ncbi:unnamed protein product, partial [Mesorhabditis belari]|uniref:7TM GPCR serpentine receptor class x (Srx) domain-containing protein n=1 Tax=Mesorhabditis belari TaxID=2138241 RepID=A0AAF3FFD7_9BILA
MSLHYMLCLLIAWVMITMLCCNFFVSLIFVKGGFLKEAAPIYSIIFYNICVGTCQLVTHIFTLLPAIFPRENIFDLYTIGHYVHSVWILSLWYAASYVHILMAANRISVFVLPRFARQLTLRNVKIALVFISILSISTSIYTQLLTPCCRLYMEQATYSYNYLPTRPGRNMTKNISKYFIDMPIESTVTGFCIISYAFICFYINKMQRKQNDGDKKEKKMMRKEIMCCVQCFLTCAFYTFTWFSVHFFPSLGFTTMEPYASISLVYMLDCGMNAVIMLLNNEEVRRKAARLHFVSGGYTIEPTNISTAKEISSTNRPPPSGTSNKSTN